MSLTHDIAAVLHKIIDGLGVAANKDALHADLDAAVAAAVQTEEKQSAPSAPSDSSPPSEPDTPAVHPDVVAVPFGTEDSPHAAQ